MDKKYESYLNSEIEELENKIIETDGWLTELKENPQGFVIGWLKNIDDTLPNLPDRKPKRKGNITMKQNLIMLRNDLQNNSIKFVEDKEKKLKDKKDKLMTKKLEKELIRDGG